LLKADRAVAPDENCMQKITAAYEGGRLRCSHRKAR